MKWQPANEAAQSWSQDPDFSGWLENIGENQNPAVWQNPRTQVRYTTEVQTLKIAEETATLLVLTPEVPSFFTMLENLGDALACGFVIYQLADNASPPLYANAAFRQHFGEPAEGLLAQTAVHPQDRPALQRALQQLKTERGTLRHSLRAWDKTQGCYWQFRLRLRWAAASMGNGAGKPVSGRQRTGRVKNTAQRRQSENAADHQRNPGAVLPFIK